jgi:hypothetical protein
MSNLKQAAEKRSGVLRRSQHERKMLNHFKSAPFALRLSKGERWIFQQLDKNERREYSTIQSPGTAMLRQDKLQAAAHEGLQ